MLGGVIITIKAIETHYKGYRFRSRLEARWAVFFDAADINYEYEKEGYEFEDGSKYLPDFWLNYYGLFVEIKGQHHTEEETNLAEKLSLYTGYPVVILTGDPMEFTYYRANKNNKFCGLLRCFVDFIGSQTDAAHRARSARFEFGEA